MRRKLLLLAFTGVLAALGVVVTTAFAAAPSAKCVISRLSTSGSGAVTARGSCGHRVAVSWSLSYQSFRAGYACGAGESEATNTQTGKFRIGPSGADKAQGVVRLKARKGKSRQAVRRFDVRLNTDDGGEPTVCGTFNDVSASKAELCPWDEPWQGSGMPQRLFDQCGAASSLARWATPMTFSGNTVTLGHPVTAGGSCRLTSKAVPPNPAPPSVDWQGVHYQGQNLTCDDGLFILVNGIYVGVINNQGVHCYDVPVGRVWSFQIPSDWGGKQLYVEAALGIFDTKRKYAVHQDLVSQTGVFNLNPAGTVDPCTVLRGRASANG